MVATFIASFGVNRIVAAVVDWADGRIGYRRPIEAGIVGLSITPATMAGSRLLSGVTGHGRLGADRSDSSSMPVRVTGGWANWRGKLARRSRQRKIVRLAPPRQPTAGGNPPVQLESRSPRLDCRDWIAEIGSPSGCGDQIEIGPHGFVDHIVAGFVVLPDRPHLIYCGN